MTHRLALLSVVTLRRDLPQHGLVSGQKGTIVDSLDGDTYDVEFTDEEGVTIALATLPVSEFLFVNR
jgi:hypothetical protein